MSENDKPFMVLEVVKELAKLRQLQQQWAEEVDEKQIVLESTDEYKMLAEAKRKQAIVQNDLIVYEEIFKQGCEDIFEETDEKKFPGGQIKMRSTLEYDEEIAIDWAIVHEHVELLSLVKGKFKKMCSGINPIHAGRPFVRKDKVGKMYIDSNLSQYLESNETDNM